MSQKNKLRKKFFHLRKKNNYEISYNFFSPLFKLIKNKFKKNSFKLALYYPSNFEVDVLKVLENNYLSNKDSLLPVIEKKNNMNIFSWKKNEVLFVNKYGIPEPI